jgi:hypothetical protein
LAVTVGAVNKPVCEIDAPADTDQVTPCGAAAGATLAEHWLVAPDEIGVAQVTVTEVTSGRDGGVMLTITAPCTEPSTLVAVTETGVAAVTVGAVNTPALDIVPLDADQVTALLMLPVPVTTAVQVSDAPEARGDAQLGTTEATLDVGTGSDGSGIELAPPPHPNVSVASTNVKAELFSTCDSMRRRSLCMRDIPSSGRVSTLI